VALVDASDRHHAECRGLLETHPGPLVVPTLALAEVVHLVGTRLGSAPEIALLGDLAAGRFLAEPVAPGDWLPIAELVARYRDLGLGTVDASVGVAANRLGHRAIATLDRRHFEVVRPELPDVELLP
jgi:uncharacterized protein